MLGVGIVLLMCSLSYGGIQYTTPSTGDGGGTTIAPTPTPDAIHATERKLTTANSINTAQQICDANSTECLDVYHNTHGLQSKGSGSSFVVLPNNSVMVIQDNDNLGVIRFQESDRSVMLEAQTASRCARFDANKKLVSAGIDCSEKSIQLNWGCADHATATATFMSTDGTCDATETGASGSQGKIAGVSGTLTTFACKASGGGPAAGDTWTFTARVDGSNTDMTCQIATSNGTCTDVGSAAVTATSRVTIAFDDTETTVAAGEAACVVRN